jgi:hypothetical protein
LIVFTGDATLLGTIQSEWDQWFQQAEPVLRRVPLLFANGNHELGAINYLSQLAMPGDELDFSVDYGPVHLTFADDTGSSPPAAIQRGATFLEQDFAASQSRPWRFLVHHRAMYSSAMGHGSNTDVRDSWGPIVDTHMIDMVFSGHDHDYERTKPMRGNVAQASPAAGTVYVVAGTAGAPFYPAQQSDFTEFSTTRYNMSLLRARAGMLDMTVYSDDGSTIDTMSIHK